MEHHNGRDGVIIIICYHLYTGYLQLYRVFTIIHLKEIMFLGYIML